MMCLRHAYAAIEKGRGWGDRENDTTVREAIISTALQHEPDYGTDAEG